MTWLSLPRKFGAVSEYGERGAYYVRPVGASYSWSGVNEFNTTIALPAPPAGTFFECRAILRTSGSYVWIGAVSPDWESPLFSPSRQTVQDGRLHGGGGTSQCTWSDVVSEHTVVFPFSNIPVFVLRPHDVGGSLTGTLTWTFSVIVDILIYRRGSDIGYVYT